MLLLLLARRCLVLLLIGVTLPAVAATLQVRHPQQESSENYPVELLALALSKAGVKFNLTPLPYQMPQGRALMQLAKGVDVNVVWSMTSIEREQELTPIRIPIDKGLLGWRIFLINKGDAAQFAKIKTLADLQKLETGQGHDWPDTTILRANGFTVQESPLYESLFRMLKAGRFRYFPRSILEIWGEEASHAASGLVVEQSILLQYPTAFYYFVNKKDKLLAATLERGLNAAIKDGSFDQLFQKTYGDVIQRANVKTRTRFLLTNPLLPAETPLDRRELWVH